MGVRMRHANLDCANLSNATFDYADLSGAQISETQ